MTLTQLAHLETWGMEYMKWCWRNLLPGTSVSVAQGRSLRPLSDASCFCVVQVLPGCFSCCPVGRTALAPTGRVLCIQPDQWALGRHSACTMLTSLSQGVVQDHLASGLTASLSKMQISGFCPGLQDLNPWGQWPESTI